MKAAVVLLAIALITVKSGTAAVGPPSNINSFDRHL